MEECEQLYAAEQYEKLLDKFVTALDAVLASSSSDAGKAGGRLPGGRRQVEFAGAPAAGSQSQEPFGCIVATVNNKVAHRQRGCASLHSGLPPTRHAAAPVLLPPPLLPVPALLPAAHPYPCHCRCRMLLPPPLLCTQIWSAAST